MMKRIILLLLVLILSVAEGLFTKQTYANGAGLPAFFKINDKLAISNPLQQFGITASSFLIPQDLAPDNYVVKQPINFAVDQTQLEPVIPPELLNNTKYTWDFGDGTKAEGLQNTHTYNKIGSYILVLTINIYEEGTTDPTKFVDSFLINVVPNANYKNVPQAIIKLNGTQVNGSNHLRDTNFNDTLTLDASDSHASSKIVQYLWNFGDGQTSTQQVVTHRYKKGSYFETVVLRIKDSNGFISDAFVGVRDTSNDQEAIRENKGLSKGTGTFSFLPLLAIGLPILVIATLLILLFRKKKHKK